MGNKLAVITGAASGIGLALAKVCTQEGMDVVMVDIAELDLTKQVAQLQISSQSTVVGMVCDVAQQEQVLQLAKRIFSEFDRVDLLINNAGISGNFAPLWEIPTEQIQHVLDVNLYGVIHGIKAFLPYLFEQTHTSHIVNIGSLYGLCCGSQLAAYAMSKHAVLALSESLYFDLRRLKKPVSVSVVCPSFTNTNLLVDAAPSHNLMLHQLLGHITMHGRAAGDTAEAIMQGIKNKAFYILPDQEVRHYCEQRTIAILEQTEPYEHSVEKILQSLNGTLDRLDFGQKDMKRASCLSVQET
ncbi:MAG: SDR family NAD(P)-dependent oxidoreductase [Legionellaceae bacterium]|nr:SDR family NAD(P)-dependent oxidoreductase [Legionellaceae bacterium]